MKYAIKITESWSRTVIVEADSYEDGVNKLEMAYDDNEITLTPDNAISELSCENDTENYVDLFGQEEFDNMSIDIR